jgi:GLPGLI family protein
MDDDKEIIAWFTPRIPVSIGPNDLFGLPGLVLLAEYPKLSRAIIAESITALAPDFTFSIPKEGKKVKKAEFDKIKAEKDKEMKMNGGGATIKIINETRSN